MKQKKIKLRLKSNERKQITAREEKILQFLWKFKIATTRSIFVRFFKGRSPETAYKIIRKLLKMHLIRYRSGSFGHQFALTLTPQGFELIKPRLPELQENGFKTEAPSHDLLCTSILLGDWVAEPPAGLQIITEQQIRRFKKEILPHWVPECKSHRPDGIWKIQNGDYRELFALEVELSTKTKYEYRELGMFYRSQNDFKKILWVVPKISIGRLIDEYLNHPTSTGNTCHNFILVDDYIQNEWNSRIFLGPDSSLPTKKMFATSLPQAYTIRPHAVNLDLSKKPFISKACRPFDYVAFCR